MRLSCFNLNLRTLLYSVAMAWLMLTGCHKQTTLASPPPMNFNGVKVDAPKLQEALSAGPEAAKTTLSQAVQMLRYGQYAQALEILQTLSGDTTLSDAQKQCLTEVLAQMKQLIDKHGPVRQ